MSRFTRAWLLAVVLGLFGGPFAVATPAQAMAPMEDGSAEAAVWPAPSPDPAMAPDGSDPQSEAAVDALVDQVEYAQSTDQLLAMVPDAVYQEYPELPDLIRGTEPAATSQFADAVVHSGEEIPPCPAAGSRLLAGLPGPYGYYQPNPTNNWCMPNSEDNGCNFIEDHKWYYDFRGACRQHDLGYRWTPVGKFAIDNRFFTDMAADCSRRSIATKGLCYTAAGIVWFGVVAFGGFAYGNTQWPGYNTPGSPVALPANTGCAQASHARFETFGLGTTLRQGARVYLTGVVRKWSRVLFQFRNSAGTLVADHVTYFARDNCVVHHEQEGFNTRLLPQGTITVSATFTRWETNEVVTVALPTLQILPPATGSTTCAQYSYGGVATFGSTTLQQGATVYLTGVVKRYTPILFQFYDASGNWITSHQTQPARSNCVVHHEPEWFSTWRLPAGAVRVTATYVEWETDQWVTKDVARLTITAPAAPPDPGDGGGGDEPPPGGCGYPYQPYEPSYDGSQMEQPIMC